MELRENLLARQACFLRGLPPRVSQRRGDVRAMILFPIYIDEDKDSLKLTTRAEGGYISGVEFPGKGTLRLHLCNIPELQLLHRVLYHRLPREIVRLVDFHRNGR